MDHLVRYVFSSFPFTSSYYNIKNFQAASVSRISHQVMRSKHLQISTLKRRVGYVDDEVVVTRSKLSRMEIDDTTQDKCAERSKTRAVGPEELD
jgi:hypothetical protein